MRINLNKTTRKNNKINSQLKCSSNKIDLRTDKIIITDHHIQKYIEKHGENVKIAKTVIILKIHIKIQFKKKEKKLYESTWKFCFIFPKNK